MNSNVEKKDHKVIFKLALIGNIFALATNISCFILYLLVLILTDFNDPVGPVLLIIIMFPNLAIIPLNIIGFGNTRKKTIISVIIGVDLFYKAYMISLFINEYNKIIGYIVGAILICLDAANLFIQGFRLDAIVEEEKEDNLI